MNKKCQSTFKHWFNNFCKGKLKLEGVGGLYINYMARTLADLNALITKLNHFRIKFIFVFIHDILTNLIGAGHLL